MRRREFITLLGGATAAWPIAARAQPTLPVVGFLHSGSPTEWTHLVAAFHQGLNERDLSDGHNRPSNSGGRICQPGLSRTGAFAVAINPSAGEGKADSLVLIIKSAVITHTRNPLTVTDSPHWSTDGRRQSALAG
jgi:hypothetical protein